MNPLLTLFLLSTTVFTAEGKHVSFKSKQLKKNLQKKKSGKKFIKNKFTKFPTRFPTRYPTRFPTDSPTESPTKHPTIAPKKFSDISNCMEWKCKDWCAFYNKEDEPIYQKYGCLDDGTEACFCE